MAGFDTLPFLLKGGVRMSELSILNNALKVLRNECSKHIFCDTCPMSDGEVCMLENEPSGWETLKEQKNEGSTSNR